jgi:hypothetical protein
MITSTNRNSSNGSTYARHRRITKGNKKVLQKVVDDFKTATDKQIFEEFSNFQDFSMAWGGGRCLRVAAGPLYVHKADFRGNPAKIERVANPDLKSDLMLILSDISVMQTLNTRWVKTETEEDSSSARTYICVFVGTNRLEVVASKWGFKGSTSFLHNKFFHWQAIARGANLANVVANDDLSSEDEDDTSSNSASTHDVVMHGLRDALPFM